MYVFDGTTLGTSAKTFSNYIFSSKEKVTHIFSDQRVLFDYNQNKENLQLQNIVLDRIKLN